NNSTAPGGGLLVTGTSQQVGAITGSGNLTLAGGSSLTANSLRQAAIIIAGSPGNIGRLAIAPSNSSGTSLSVSASRGQVGLFGAVQATGSFGDGFVKSNNSFLALPALESPTIEATGAAST